MGTPVLGTPIGVRWHGWHVACHGEEIHPGHRGECVSLNYQFRPTSAVEEPVGLPWEADIRPSAPARPEVIQAVQE